MYMQDGDPEVRKEPWLNLTTGVAAISTVVLSIVAVPLFTWAANAVLKLF
jgi:hypothetical protein